MEKNPIGFLLREPWWCFHQVYKKTKAILEALHKKLMPPKTRRHYNKPSTQDMHCSWFLYQLELNVNITSVPTNWFVSHSHIPGGPATEAAGQIVGLLHGRLGGIIRQRSRDVGGPGGQCVHAAWAVETVDTPTMETIRRTFKWDECNEVKTPDRWVLSKDCLVSPVLFKLSLCRGHVLQTAGTIVGVHLITRNMGVRSQTMQPHQYVNNSNLNKSV